MNRRKLVDDFFIKGHLLSPELLEEVSGDEGKARKLLETRHEQLVIQKAAEPQDIFKILKTLEAKPSPTKEMQLSFYKSKYEKMRAIITERLQKNFVSLNKIGTMREEVFAIGIVKDIREEEGKKIVDLEDQTATVPVLFSQPVDCELDDVIAVQAIAGGRVMFGKKIMYPDIPLRKPTTGSGRACFVSDLHIDQLPRKFIERFFNWVEGSDIEYLFVAGDIGDMKTFQEACGTKKTVIIPGNVDAADDYPYLPIAVEKKNITSLSNPSMVSINGVNILMIHDFDIAMLKKRYLGRSSTILNEDYLALDEVPDIVHYGHTHKPFVSNYKATTLVNSGSPLASFTPVIIDLQSRECKQVDFNIG